MTLGQLETGDRKLISLMGSVFFGRLENLDIENGHAKLVPGSRKIATANFDKDDAPHAASRADGDFILTERHVRFLRRVGGVKAGKIHSVTIQNGLPVRADIEEAAETN